MTAAITVPAMKTAVGSAKMPAKPRRRIIPVFIPAAACPGNCVFCDQKTITGVAELPDDGDVVRQIREGMMKNPYPDEEIEVAFYGGTFTLASEETMDGWLSASRTAAPGCPIRISTRPDAMDDPMVSWLRARGVTTVELGCQSMDDRVLEVSGRGHGRAEIISAAGAVTRGGLVLGMQLMMGLPGEDADSFGETVALTIDQGPSFVRIYPVLVIRGTPLERMYIEGTYRPWDLETTVGVMAGTLRKFKAAGIEVARVGLHGDSDWIRNNVIAGPAHPNVREMSEARLYLEKFAALSGRGAVSGMLSSGPELPKEMLVRVSPRCISKALGPGRINVSAMAIHGLKLEIRPDPELSDDSFAVAVGESVFLGTIWT